MNISIKEAAQLMNKSEQFVRIGLQQNIFPFGVAIKQTGNKYSYYVSAPKFEEYTGIKIPKKENTTNDILDKWNTYQ